MRRILMVLLAGLAVAAGACGSSHSKTFVTAASGSGSGTGSGSGGASAASGATDGSTSTGIVTSSAVASSGASSSATTSATTTASSGASSSSSTSASVTASSSSTGGGACAIGSANCQNCVLGMCQAQYSACAADNACAQGVMSAQTCVCNAQMANDAAGVQKCVQQFESVDAAANAAGQCIATKCKALCGV